MDVFGDFRAGVYGRAGRRLVGPTKIGGLHAGAGAAPNLDKEPGAVLEPQGSGCLRALNTHFLCL